MGGRLGIASLSSFQVVRLPMFFFLCFFVVVVIDSSFYPHSLAVRRTKGGRLFYGMLIIRLIDVIKAWSRSSGSFFCSYIQSLSLVL